MITKFKIFESKNPDLRAMSEYVRCVKDTTGFRKDNIYKVIKQFGDPQRAIEEFGINDYMPLECISAVHIEDDIKSTSRFIVNDYYNNKEWEKTYRYFLDYFEPMEEANIGKKYNL